jgi:glycosyltransferase involved in cell wall biosynthesis
VNLNMKILFLTVINMENINEPGIYTDLLRELDRQGHEVCVVCPREKRFGKKTSFHNSESIKKLYVMTGNVTKTSYFEKGLAILLMPWRFLFAIKKYLHHMKFDLILYSTPPITLVAVIKKLKKQTKASTYLLLKDIWPQGIVDLGVIRAKGFIEQYFRKKEVELYKVSDYIGCMSQANVDYVLKHNPFVKADRVEVCPNSIDPLNIVIDDKKAQEIKVKYNIPIGKTVFIYGGNLGKPQGIDFLIECLKSNKDNEQIYFVIAGSGTEFNKLKKYFENEKPKNAQLFSQLAKNDYEILANSCDVGLIFLDKSFTIPNFPSRLLSYIQASMPVLAATDVNTDVGKVIEEGEFGFWCESSDVNEFNKKVQQLCNPELRKRMGINARRYLENHYTSRHSYEIIMKHFE